MQDYPLKTA